MKKHLRFILGVIGLVLILGCSSTPVTTVNNKNDSLSELKPTVKESTPVVMKDKIATLEETKKTAKEQGKDILIDFCGSDWCGWCMKLEEEVFGTEEWQKTGLSKYVVLSLDFPKNKKLPKEQEDYNQAMMLDFGIEGFPTIILLDSNGNPYAKTGYQAGGPEKYLEHLNELSEQKVNRDKLLKLIKETPSEKRLKVLDEFVVQLKKWGIGFAYNDVKEEIVTLDVDNKAGLKLTYATELAGYYNNKGNKDKTESYLGMVKKIDVNKGSDLEIDLKLRNIGFTYIQKGDWKGTLDALKEIMDSNPKGEAGQKVFYYAAIAHLKLNDKDKVVENLETALKLAPDSQLGKRIKATIDKLKSEPQPTETAPK